MCSKRQAFRWARDWSTYLPHCGQRGKPVCAITTLRTKLWTPPSSYPRACDILRAFAFSGCFQALRYESVNRQWEMADLDHRSHGWPHARHFVVARRFIPEEGAETTLFTMGRYMYRAWVTNMDLTAAGVWHFYDGRAAMEPRICELREDYALRKIPTSSFAANALYLEIIRLAYNLVTAFQRNCLEESWQSLTLQTLRYKLFLLPGELTRPQNRPILRLRESPLLQDPANDILRKVHRLKPIQV